MGSTDGTENGNSYKQVIAYIESYSSISLLDLKLGENILFICNP